MPIECWQAHELHCDEGSKGDWTVKVLSNQKRLPPGQMITAKFPAMLVGTVPNVELSTWDLRVFGLVSRAATFKWDDILALPTFHYTADLHCVTSWSRLDNHWEGVSLRDLMTFTEVLPTAKHVLVHAEQGFTVNLSMEDALQEGVMLAYKHDGEDLTPEHGFPLRLVVPHLYAWKSAKWIRAIEFLNEEQPGFWEQRGYHIHGDPWTEERYANPVK